MAKPNGGSWHLNYQIKTGVGTPADKFQANVNRTKKGLNIVVNAGIPELDEDMMDQLESHMDSAVEEMDGADATDPSSHKDCLRAIAEYCNWLAGVL